MAHDDDRGIELRPGSVYRVYSADSGDRSIVTIGTFLGYTGIGNDEAMSFELGEDHAEDAGLVRVLPVGTIFAIDVLEHAETEADEEDEVGPSYL